ncbi:MAG: type II secretion system protein [bacterium]|nr:type II secretion system protein [bacterium]
MMMGVGAFVPTETRPKGVVNRKRAPSPMGFTLVELLVVTAIIMVITAITMNSQTSFNKSLILANTAYDIALTFRSAETYGISSRVVNGNTNVGYGIHIQTAPNHIFTLFADTDPSPNCHGLPSGGAGAPNAVPGDCMYTPSQDEKIQEYNIGNSIYMTNFCVYESGSWSCASDGLTTLDIVFARPNPDPFINVTGSRACVALASTQGGSRSVWVEASGAITANASPCPS